MIGQRLFACLVHDAGMGNESSCMESLYYTPFDIEKYNGPLIRSGMYLLKKIG